MTPNWSFAQFPTLPSHRCPLSKECFKCKSKSPQLECHSILQLSALSASLEPIPRMFTHWFREIMISHCSFCSTDISDQISQRGPTKNIQVNPGWTSLFLNIRFLTTSKLVLFTSKCNSSSPSTNRRSTWTNPTLSVSKNYLTPPFLSLPLNDVYNSTSINPHTKTPFLGYAMANLSKNSIKIIPTLKDYVYLEF